MSNEKITGILGGTKKTIHKPLRNLSGDGSVMMKKPILHLHARSGSNTPVAGTDFSHHRKSRYYLDPEIESHEPSEILAPLQIYATPQWRHIWTEWDWIITSLGVTFNVINIIRFPYLVANYGGVSFLVPYFIMVAFLGLPCLYLEAIIGQFTRVGPLVSWKLCPLFKGIGYSIFFLNFINSVYTNVFGTWSLTYVLASSVSIFAAADFEWMNCSNEWNTKVCVPIDGINRTAQTLKDANMEYFNRYILGQDGSWNYSFWSMGNPFSTKSFLIMSTISVLVFVSAIKIGIKGLPRLSMIIFGIGLSNLCVVLLRCTFLPGGIHGIKHYLKPDWNKLINHETWLEAGRYTIGSLGIGVGIHMLHGSFKPFSNSILRNCILPIAMSIFTSIGGAILSFALIGFGGKLYNKALHMIMLTTPEFVFEGLPSILYFDTSFPSNFYYLCLYGCISLVAILGSVVRIINIRLSLLDQWNEHFAEPVLRKWVLLFVALCLLGILISIPLISQSGIAWIHLYQEYVDGIAQPFLIFIEFVVFAWIYGINTINECNISMNASHISVIFLWTWKFIVPPLSMMIWILGTIDILILRSYRSIQIPIIAKLIGIFILLILCCTIVITAVVIGRRRTETFGKLKILALISPEYETNQILEEKDGKRLHWKHYLSLGKTKISPLPKASSADIQPTTAPVQIIVDSIPNEVETEVLLEANEPIQPAEESGQTLEKPRKKVPKKGKTKFNVAKTETAAPTGSKTKASKPPKRKRKIEIEDWLSTIPPDDEGLEPDVESEESNEQRLPHRARTRHHSIRRSSMWRPR